MKTFFISQIITSLVCFLTVSILVAQNRPGLFFNHFNNSAPTDLIDFNGHYVVLSSEVETNGTLKSTDFPAATIISTAISQDSLIRLPKHASYYSFPRSGKAVGDTLYILMEYLDLSNQFPRILNYGLVKIADDWSIHQSRMLLETDSSISYESHQVLLEWENDHFEMMALINDSSPVKRPFLFQFTRGGNITYEKIWNYDSNLPAPIGAIMDFKRLGNGSYAIANRGKYTYSYLIADTASTTISQAVYHPNNHSIWQIENSSTGYTLFGLGDAPGLQPNQHKDRFAFWKVGTSGSAIRSLNQFALSDTTNYLVDLLASPNNTFLTLGNGSYIFAGDEFYQGRNQPLGAFSTYSINKADSSGNLVWRYEITDSLYGETAPVVKIIKSSQNNSFVALRAYVSPSTGMESYSWLQSFGEDGAGLSIPSTKAAISTIKVYPNPVKQGAPLYVQLDKSTISKETELEVLDLQGKVHLKRAINTTRERVDTQSLAKGVYLIRLDHSISKAVIVE